MVVGLGRAAEDQRLAVRDEEGQVARVLVVLGLDQADSHAGVGDDNELTSNGRNGRVAGQLACA
jgi:hypothetical protein